MPFELINPKDLKNRLATPILPKLPAEQWSEWPVKRPLMNGAK
jgi:hypothetical protein